MSDNFVIHRSAFNPGAAELRRLSQRFYRDESEEACGDESRSAQHRKLIEHDLPEIASLARQTRKHLEGAAGAVLIDCSPLAGFALDIKEAFSLNLCLLLGRPTALDGHRNSIVWHVARRESRDYGPAPMVSETNRRAELHTDSAHRQLPERYVALYCVRPAADGGGVTHIVDGEQALAILRTTENGRHHESVLRHQPVPIQVPESISPQRLQILRVPLIQEVPMLRFRQDLVDLAYATTGETPDQDLRAAVCGLKSAINRSCRREFTLLPDSLLLVNNHRMLHGRTEFSDPARLLLRVRVHSIQPN